MEPSKGLSLNISSSLVSSIWSICVLKWTWHQCFLSPCICYCHPSVPVSQEINAVSLAELSEGMGIEIYSFSFFPFGVWGDSTKWRCFRRHKWTWLCCWPPFELGAFAKDLQRLLAGSMTLWTRPPIAAVVLTEWAVQDISGRAGISTWHSENSCCLCFQ